MIVKAQYRGNRVAGLYVGTSNVRRYFSKRLRMIELQLDHLRIVCGLAPHFWQDKPEILDPRLCLWLESKQRQAEHSQTEIQLVMIPSDKNSFRLAAIAERSTARPGLADVRNSQTLIA